LIATLDWAASVHDQNQVELTFDYRVRKDERALSSHPDPRPRFSVDLFLVAPPSLGLDDEAYPKAQFLSDLTQRMRLQPPHIGAFEQGRIPSLDRYLALELDLGAKQALEGRVVQDVRLFANAVNARFSRLFRDDQIRADLKYKRDLDAAVRVIDAFRARYVEPMRERGLLFGDAVREAVHLVDEFLHARMTTALSKAAMAGKRKALAALEAHASHNPQLVAVAGGPRDPARIEAFAHRSGQLKKFVGEVLYLDRVDVNREQLWRNLAAAGGAGLAALFAETARYYNTVATGTQDFGLHAAFFIGLAVIAYVFKDRLKDLSKDYLGRRVARRIPDRVSMLVLPHIGATNQLARVAVCHHEEAVRRLDVTGLPAEVVYVWERGAEPIPGPARHVLHYGKQVWLNPSALVTLDRDELAVKDIVRLDLSTFLSHLDNPLKEMALFDAEEGSIVTRAPKVYRLDLVIRLCHEDRTGASDLASVEMVRVVLDKNGIVRMERPFEAGRYQFNEARTA
jgi:hypothetical protein